MRYQILIYFTLIIILLGCSQKERFEKKASINKETLNEVKLDSALNPILSGFIESQKPKDRKFVIYIDIEENKKDLVLKLHTSIQYSKHDPFNPTFYSFYNNQLVLICTGLERLAYRYYDQKQLDDLITKQLYGRAFSDEELEEFEGSKLYNPRIWEVRKVKEEYTVTDSNSTLGYSRMIESPIYFTPPVINNKN